MRPSDMGTWKAPVGPIPEFLPPGTKLIHLPESFVNHGVAPGSSLAYEALYASTGVSHLEV